MWPSATTRPVVLVGDPVAHSLSPAIHNAAFRELGLDLVYVACRVTRAGLADALNGLLALGAAGVNVTLPHKPAAATLAGQLSAEAAATGVVNTLVPTDAGWIGANTDVEGFLTPLRAANETEHREIVILGAGGAARAVAYGLLTEFAPQKITVASRDVARAARLVSDLAAFDAQAILHPTGMATLAQAVGTATLVVNATPVGMTPAVNDTPCPDPAVFGPQHIVYDLIYTPAPTRLLRDAATRGARTIDGREMLLHQAAASFRLWTGRDMPLGVARTALEHALAQNAAPGAS